MMTVDSMAGRVYYKERCLGWWMLMQWLEEFYYKEGWLGWWLLPVDWRSPFEVSLVNAALIMFTLILLLYIIINQLLQNTILCWNTIKTINLTNDNLVHVCQQKCAKPYNCYLSSNFIINYSYNDCTYLLLQHEMFSLPVFQHAKSLESGHNVVGINCSFCAKIYKIR